MNSNDFFLPRFFLLLFNLPSNSVAHRLKITDLRYQKCCLVHQEQMKLIDMRANLVKQSTSIYRSTSALTHRS
jgi:hypothetical protein